MYCQLLISIVYWLCERKVSLYIYSIVSLRRDISAFQTYMGMQKM